MRLTDRKANREKEGDAQREREHGGRERERERERRTERGLELSEILENNIDIFTVKFTNTILFARDSVCE